MSTAHWAANWLHSSCNQKHFLGHFQIRKLRSIMELCVLEQQRRFSKQRGRRKDIFARQYVETYSMHNAHWEGIPFPATYSLLITFTASSERAKVTSSSIESRLLHLYIVLCQFVQNSIIDKLILFKFVSICDIFPINTEKEPVKFSEIQLEI